jgi:cyclopropane fatty-acyl-phospholipid synthase-like methyltransferase
MSHFELNTRFDAVICIYHGVNHLLGFPSWEGFFDCACRHLNDGGVLVFDILTIATLKMMAGIPEIVQQSGGHGLRIKVRASAESVFDWHIKMLAPRQEGGHEPLTEVIRTASFPLGKIRDALSERFAGIEIIESDGGVSDDGGGRIWFVCSSPRRPARR